MQTIKTSTTTKKNPQTSEASNINRLHLAWRPRLKPTVSQLLVQNQLECTWQHWQREFDYVHKTLHRDAFARPCRSNQEHSLASCILIHHLIIL